MRSLTKYMPEEVALFKNLIEVCHLCHHEIVSTMSRLYKANKTTQVDIPNKVQHAKTLHDSGIAKDEQTVFGALFDSDLPAEEKTVFRLSGEATTILLAGTETTSWTLSVTTFYLLANPLLLGRLAEELQTVVQDPRKLPRLSVLEQLPFLSAVILEGLRLSYGVPGRTPRIASQESLVYRGTWAKPGVEASESSPVSVEYIVPRGTPIGMSAWITHHREDIFPDSNAFSPDRWLDEEGRRRKDLEKYLSSFSRGSRSCLGIK